MHEVLKKMSKEKLLALASLLKLYDPKSGCGKYHFSILSHDSVVNIIIEEVSSSGGHTIANMFRGGKGVSYRTVVSEVAAYVEAGVTKTDTIEEAEAKVAKKVFRTLVAKLNVDQQQHLAAKLAKISKSHGGSYASEALVLAALTTAQLSGFGVYLTASTVVGAVSHVLGLILPFPFYTTMSTVISVLIGPLGWTALGLAAVYKAGKPNMQKLLPVVLFIAAERHAPKDNAPRATFALAKVVITVAIIVLVLAILLFWLWHRM